MNLGFSMGTWHFGSVVLEEGELLKMEHDAFLMSLLEELSLETDASPWLCSLEVPGDQGKEGNKTLETPLSEALTLCEQLPESGSASRVCAPDLPDKLMLCMPSIVSGRSVKKSAKGRSMMQSSLCIRHPVT